MSIMIEIGRTDISTEVSIILLFLAYPLEVHIMSALHIMEYLKYKHNYCLVFDITYPVIDKTTFNEGAKWKEFYCDDTKSIPPDALDPRGK